jgi:hypothetical protein
MSDATTKEREYLDPETGRDVSAADLKALQPDDQKRIIKYWFLEHYENPAENTPYETAEGGYIYIWGGPHDADQVLQEEFSEGFSEEFLSEIADELEEECGTNEWASIPGTEDFDLSYLVSEFHPRFQASVETIRGLRNENINDSSKRAFFALLYANVITVLEAYLSDVFISLIVRNETLLRKFVESDPLFREQKIPTAEIFRHMESIPARVKGHLYVLPFHRLEKVQRMYAAVLQITFPAGMAEILKAVHIRHDIVHRNCVTKDGKEIVISRAEVENLLKQVEIFVGETDKQVLELVEKVEVSPLPDIPMPPTPLL